jgi:tRNA(Ile)-lysidine synthase
MNPFEKRTLDFMRDNRLVSRGDKVVVAVSGGADSVCLLHILRNIESELGIELHVAHLDHGLREGSSCLDAQYVGELAEKLELPSTIEKRDVQNYWQKHRLSLEEAAREVRYQFLEEVVKKQGAASVAVAHTMNDHVETVLLHILRGSGLTGLVGLKQATILKYKRVGPLKVIRPLLWLNRDEVEAYCKESDLDYRTDATNESLTQTRNRIRLKLLPQLRRDFNPKIDDAIDRLSRLAADDVDFIEGEAKRAAAKLILSDHNITLIDRASFLELRPALRRGVLRQLLSTELGSPKDVEATHIEDMNQLAEGDTGQSINLPDKLTFVVGYSDLMLGRNLSKVIPLPPLEGQYLINIPGVTELSGWRVTATVIDSVGGMPTEKTEKPFTQYMDFDTTTNSLTVRTRLAGDRFQPLGMSTEKTLKDFLIDSKVPRTWRERVPIVVNPGQIVWVAGYRLDDRIKVTPSTKRILRLEFVRQPYI